MRGPQRETALRHGASRKHKGARWATLQWASTAVHASSYRLRIPGGRRHKSSHSPLPGFAILDDSFDSDRAIVGPHWGPLHHMVLMRHRHVVPSASWKSSITSGLACGRRGIFRRSDHTGHLCALLPVAALRRARPLMAEHCCQTVVPGAHPWRRTLTPLPPKHSRRKWPQPIAATCRNSIGSNCGYNAVSTWQPHDNRP